MGKMGSWKWGLFDRKVFRSNETFKLSQTVRKNMATFLNSVSYSLQQFEHALKLQALMKFFPAFANPFGWSAKPKQKSKTIARGANPYADAMLRLKGQISCSGDMFGDTVSIKQRTDDWNEFDDAWDPLRMNYAWAVPDTRALNILAEFSPLIEIGAGNGYWAALLRNMDADIVCFDAYPEKALSWTKVSRGGPEQLLDKRFADRSLFLCYPDEQESIAIECLENFNGQYLIHVGELAVVGTMGEAPQAPFGRTSSAEFQVALLQSFHCLLVAELQVQLPFGKDCISVWKRTKYVLGRRFDSNLSAISEEDEEDEENEDEEGEDDEDDDEEERPNRTQDAFVGSMSKEELSKLRGLPAVGASDASSSAAAAVSYISQNELAKLRGESVKNKKSGATSTARKISDSSYEKCVKGSSSTSGSGAVVEYMSKADLDKLRGQSSIANTDDDDDEDGDDDEDDEEEEDDDDDDEEEEEGSLAMSNKRRKISSREGSGSGSALAGFISRDELAALRKQERTHEKSGGTRSSGSSFLSVIGNVSEGLNIGDKKRIREERERSLDLQYFESDEKRWASIPATERLPVDRAAPCLEYLLEV